MKLKNVKYYVNRLISDGHKWQNIDVNGKYTVPRLYFSNIQWVIIGISIASIFLIKNGFNNDFVGYIIASLSIFVGLFLTLILTVFDKFEKTDFGKKNKSEKEKVSLIKKKNFFKQFTALTSYSILISLACILLLSTSMLSEVFSRNVFEYAFVTDINEATKEEVLAFITNISIVLHRLIIVYLFVDFLLMVLYALSSIYNYISIEYDKKNVENG